MTVFLSETNARALPATAWTGEEHDWLIHAAMTLEEVFDFPRLDREQSTSVGTFEREESHMAKEALPAACGILHEANG